MVGIALGSMREISGRIEAGKGLKIVDEMRLIVVAASQSDVHPINVLRFPKATENLLKALDAAEQPEHFHEIRERRLWNINEALYFIPLLCLLSEPLELQIQYARIPFQACTSLVSLLLKKFNDLGLSQALLSSRLDKRKRLLELRLKRFLGLFDAKLFQAGAEIGNVPRLPMARFVFARIEKSNDLGIIQTFAGFLPDKLDTRRELLFSFLL